MFSLKKRLLTLLLTVCLVLCFTGCAKEMTLSLSYGDRTGKYSGDLVDGVPHGQGKFTTTNAEGETWTYEGEFKNGHFDGEGKTTWKSGQGEIGTYKDDVIVPLKGDEIKTLFTTPENFKDHCVEVIGKVFAAPEYVDDGVAIQMWTDFENAENNVIVYVMDKDFKVEEEDYVKVVGLVGEPFTGENAFGGEITAPTVYAREYEVISYADAAMPTLKEVNVEQTQEQFGYAVTVQKVEFAEKETRVYIKVVNNGSDKFNLYSFNTKLSQDGKQFEEQDNWDAEYPEIQTELLVGNTTEGIIAFPAIEQKAFSIIIDASSDNWDEELNPYTFNIEF